MNQGIREISLNGNFLSAEGLEAWMGSKGVGKGDVAFLSLESAKTTSKALQNPPRIHGGNKSDGWTRSQELTILISNCNGPGSSGGHVSEDSSGRATAGDQDGSSVKEVAV